MKATFVLLILLIGSSAAQDSSTPETGDEEATTEPETTSTTDPTEGEGEDADPETEVSTTSTTSTTTTTTSTTTTISTTFLPALTPPSPTTQTLTLNFSRVEEVYTFLLDGKAFLDAVGILTPRVPKYDKSYKIYFDEELVAKVSKTAVTLNEAKLSCLRTQGYLFEPSNDQQLQFALREAGTIWVSLQLEVEGRNVYTYNVSHHIVPELLGVTTLQYTDVSSFTHVTFGNLPGDKIGFKSVAASQKTKYICVHEDPEIFNKIRRAGRYKYMSKTLNSVREEMAPQLQVTYNKMKAIKNILPRGKCQGKEMQLSYPPYLASIGSVWGTSFRAHTIILESPKFNEEVKSLIQVFTDSTKNPRKDNTNTWCVDTTSSSPSSREIPTYETSDDPMILWPEAVIAVMTVLLTLVSVASLLYTIMVSRRHRLRMNNQLYETTQGQEMLPLNETRRVRFSSSLPSIPTAPPPPYNPNYPSHSSSSDTSGPEDMFT